MNSVSSRGQREAAAPAGALVALCRLMPGLFPPPNAGIGGTERRVVLTLLVVTMTAATIGYRLLGGLSPIWLEAGWAGVLASVAVPWHRLPGVSFGAVSVALTAGTAVLVWFSGGSDSAFAGLFYLSVMLGCVIAPPLWLGLGLGALASAANMLPIAYESLAAVDTLLVRSGLLLAAAFFGSWLVDELTRVVVVATIDRRRLGEEQEAAAEARRSAGPTFRAAIRRHFGSRSRGFLWPRIPPRRSSPATVGPGI